MKHYIGTRTSDGCEVVVTDGSRTRDLDPRHDLRNHSPDGFNWGYGGSGPAQLALALAADALGDDERAQRVYQPLKFKVVGRLQGDGFDLNEDDIRQAVVAIEAEKGRSR